MGVIEVVRRQQLEQAVQQGLQQGLQQGVQQGLQQGVQQGLQEGLQQKSFEVVKNLITQLSLSDEQTARIAGVSVDFVRQVRAELSQKK